MKLKQTTNQDPDFIRLTRELDAELNARYGKAQEAYDGHNRIDPIDTALVGYVDGRAVACGCFKAIDPSIVEIKRMFVEETGRRNGLSTLLLEALERWAAGRGHESAILETGKGQPEAIAFYRKQGYTPIENYGPYVGIDNSVCMEKRIGP